MDRSRREKKALRLLAWSALIATATALPVMAAESDNLVADPGFESGVSGFEGQDPTTVVAQSTTAPLSGSASLSVHIDGFGNHVWWTKMFTNGLASQMRISAHLRSDVASSSTLRFCAGFYYADSELQQSCTAISGAVGDKGIVNQQIAIDPTRPLSKLVINLEQDGGSPVTFTLDDATVIADVVREPDPDGNPPNNPPPSCNVSPNTVYHPVPYTPPAARPYVSLAAFTQVNQQSSAYQRFKTVTDNAGASDAPDPYFSTYAIIMYRITGNPTYLEDAIARVNAFVNQAEADALNHIVPGPGHDRFLHSPDYLEPLALTYDAAFTQLTDAQKAKWTQLAEDTLENLWNRNPSPQTWFNVTGFPDETAWSVCDPGNNYYFGFLQSTMLWALASQNSKWFELLQQKKFPILLDYYTQFPGGGTREGTGYGTALKNLLKDYIYWKDSTPENLATVTSHPRETIDYWVHATVPTLDRFAPIGDLSRESIPNLYDYQRNLVHQAVVLSPGTSEARHGTWWLQHISVSSIERPENLWGDLLSLNDSPLAPTALAYHSPGAGVLFARSSWSNDASWLSFVAGQYDQSHAHQEQGSFTFFKHDWLAVSANIWSQSGIHQETTFNNQLRFERSDGSEIPQSYGQSTLSVSNTGGVVTAQADLTDVYAPNSTSVHSWSRTLHYTGDSLRVTDVCAVGNGITPVFQMHVPVQPVLQADGSVIAGNLHITPLQGVMTPTFLAMNTTGPGTSEPTLPEFSQGYRIDFKSTVGCSFDFQLEAQ